MISLSMEPFVFNSGVEINSVYVINVTNDTRLRPRGNQRDRPFVAQLVLGEFFFHYLDALEPQNRQR